jgi:urease accessory protein
VEAGYLTDAQTLKEWVGHIVGYGAGYLDSVILAATWDAVRNKNQQRFIEIAERSAANRATSEMALESDSQGAAFLDAIDAAWHAGELETWTALLSAQSISLTYPVATGMTAALQDVELPAVVLAFLHGTSSNLVSAGMRLIPLGQAAGQSVIADLEDVVIQSQGRALSTTLDQAGTAAPMVDWTSMQHETQYTRLFRS